MESQTTISPELDGIDSNDIAVCGLSLKFPQDATTPEALWDMMLQRHCAMTEFPPDRVNVDGFYDQRSRPNTVNFYPNFNFRIPKARIWMVRLTFIDATKRRSFHKR